MLRETVKDFFIRIGCKQMLSISDLKPLNIRDLAKTIKDGKPLIDELRILVIDDQEFPYIEALQEYGYHIEQRRDASPDKADSFDVILCDRNGVGKTLRSSKQGGALAQAIKERFPLKFVALYTTSPDGLQDFDVMKALDDIVQPGGDVDDFKRILDAWSAKLLDPREQWIRLRCELLKKGAPICEVARMEDAFVRRFNQGNTSSISESWLRSFVSGVAQSLVVEFAKMAVFRILPKLVI